ncbi:MAG: hypothetical protein ACLFV7_13420 [Phycisphaerae bacterium]
MSGKKNLPPEEEDDLEFDAPEPLPIDDEDDENGVYEDEEDYDLDEFELEEDSGEEDEEDEYEYVELTEEEVEELKELLGFRVAYELIESETDGLYEEMDKLCQLAPKERATRLQMEAVNKVIRRCKVLLEGDLVVDEIEQFPVRRELPEYRDVVTVLRQLAQALKRFSEGSNAYLWSEDFEFQCDAAGLGTDDAKDVLEDA